MSPRYGRAFKGQRVYYPAPYQRGNYFTLISAISYDKVEAALYGQWTGNSETFCHFLEYHLCTKLRKEQVVVMDNVAFHKVTRVNELIQAAGAQLLYLPPYSPEFNPIENMWSKIKTALRKTAARTIDELKPAVADAFQHIRQHDLRQWFRHCGYLDQCQREVL